MRRLMGRWRELFQIPLLGISHAPCPGCCHGLLAQSNSWGDTRSPDHPQPSLSPRGCLGAVLGDTNSSALPAGGFASTSRSPSARRCSAWTGTPTTSCWPPAPATSSAGEGQGDNEGGPQGWCGGSRPDTAWDEQGRRSLGAGGTSRLSSPRQDLLRLHQGGGGAAEPHAVGLQDALWGADVRVEQQLRVGAQHLLLGQRRPRGLGEPRQHALPRRCQQEDGVSGAGVRRGRVSGGGFLLWVPPRGGLRGVGGCSCFPGAGAGLNPKMMWRWRWHGEEVKG